MNRTTFIERQEKFMLTVNEYAQLSARTYDRTLENKI